MKKTIYILAAICAMMACAKGMETPVSSEEPKDKIQDNENLVTVTVGVKMDDAATKVVIGEDGTSRYLKWKDGDVISIGWRGKEGSSKAGEIGKWDKTLTVTNESASFTLTYDDSIYEVTDARYPQGGTNASIPTTQYLWRGDIIIPLTAVFDGSQSEISFAPVTEDYCIVKYTLTGIYGECLEAIEVKHNGGTKYTLDTKTEMGGKGVNQGVLLSADPKEFFIVLPSSTTEGSLEATFKTDQNTSGYVKTKQTFTPAQKVLHSLPALSLGEIGKYRWKLGKEETVEPSWLEIKSIVSSNPFNEIATAGNSSDTPRLSFPASDNDYVILTAGNNNAPYRSDFAPLFYGKNHVYYGYTEKSGEAPLYYYTAKYRRTTSDSERLTIHAGKYPIIAVKMSNLEKTFKGSYSASSYSFKFDVNSNASENGGISYAGSGNYSWNTSRVLGTQTTNANHTDGDDYLVYYFDFSSNNFKVNNVASQHFPTDKPVDIYSLNFVLADIKDASSAPSINIKWIGTFEDVAELTTYNTNNP